MMATYINQRSRLANRHFNSSIYDSKTKCVTQPYAEQPLQYTPMRQIILGIKNQMKEEIISKIKNKTQYHQSSLNYLRSPLNITRINPTHSTQINQQTFPNTPNKKLARLQNTPRKTQTYINKITLNINKLKSKPQKTDPSLIQQTNQLFFPMGRGKMDYDDSTVIQFYQSKPIINFKMLYLNSNNKKYIHHQSRNRHIINKVYATHRKTSKSNLGYNSKLIKPIILPKTILVNSKSLLSDRNGRSIPIQPWN